MHIDIQPFAEYAVAPYVGAWIETFAIHFIIEDWSVAPYVGAWIETHNKKRFSHQEMSHPTWVRGLKQLTEHKGDKNLKSHPTWVRGLKHLSMMRKMNSCSSHPTWVRGLKLKWQTLRIMYHPVAPYVGAWIETSSD